MWGVNEFHLQQRERGDEWEKVDVYSDPERASCEGIRLHEEHPSMSFRVVYWVGIQEKQHVYWRTL